MLKLKLFFFKIILPLLFLNYQQLTNSVTVKFTKFVCFEFDKPFADIPKCFLKALGRDKVGLDLHVRLHQVPVSNVSVSGCCIKMCGI